MPRNMPNDCYARKLRLYTKRMQRSTRKLSIRRILMTDITKVLDHFCCGIFNFSLIFQDSSKPVAPRFDDVINHLKCNDRQLKYTPPTPRRCQLPFHWTNVKNLAIISKENSKIFTSHETTAAAKASGTCIGFSRSTFDIIAYFTGEIFVLKRKPIPHLAFIVTIGNDYLCRRKSCADFVKCSMWTMCVHFFLAAHRIVVVVAAAATAAATRTPRLM